MSRAMFLRNTVSKSVDVYKNLKISFPERWKGTRKEKICNYFLNILQDYKMAMADIGADMKKKPLKASFYLAGLATLGIMVKTNPSEQSFRCQLIDNTTDLMMIGNAIRNPKSSSHIEDQNKLALKGCLNYQSLLFFSVMYRTEFSSEVGLYEANCKFVKPHWTEFHKSVVDVGLFGRWIYLDKAMKDFDINPYDWKEDGTPKQAAFIPMTEIKVLQ
ncbi:hypothetical protein CHS0354_006267 [Potamilus streckersoni]|uniref:Uncharacterized protein n=1 Tax=Potamilus streckersoni TaxID=2493646 RepID=A0AAE0SNB4_9BIVA|nr:hypothetical protein CHS0354_006267 [Potamilus streckersoni]